MTIACRALFGSGLVFSFASLSLSLYRRNRRWPAAKVLPPGPFPDAVDKWAGVVVLVGFVIALVTAPCVE